MKTEDVKCLCGHPRWMHERRLTPHEYEDCRSRGCECTHYMPPESVETPAPVQPPEPKEKDNV